MSTQANLGASALERKDFAAAIKHYTSALAEFPTSPDFYIKRSVAYQRSSPPQHNLALQDADSAVHYAYKRGKRELIATGQMRRGISLFGMKRWADAGQCFAWVRVKNDKEPGLEMWTKKAQVALEKAGEGAEGTNVSVVEIPEPSAATTNNHGPSAPARTASSGTSTIDASNSHKTKPVQGVQTPADKIRHEWYQTTDTVVVTLLAKGVPKDQATIDFHETSVSALYHAQRRVQAERCNYFKITISFPMPTGSTYDFSADPLFAPIDPTSSKSSIMSTKIELVLKKSTPGHKWKSLEGSHETRAGKDQPDQKPDEALEVHEKQATSNGSSGATSSDRQSSVPSYPTSSRTGPKDWDKLAAELSKKAKGKPDDADSTKQNGSQTTEQAPKAGENDDVSIDDDDDEGDQVHGFFKKIYANADPDTRRAMMKSYQESNGTALSTNWAEVGKAKMETTPPDGMVARQWNE